MRKTLIILLSIINTVVFGQIIGPYYGKEVQFLRISNKNDSTYIYHNKQIHFFEDSTFHFWMTYMTDNSTCYGCTDTIYVSGYWELDNDTIVLNSKFKSNDFIEIIGFNTDNKYSTFVYNTRYLCKSSDQLIINDSLKIDIFCSNVYTKSIIDINSIVFRKYIESIFLYEIQYEPDVYKPNFFTINPIFSNRDNKNMSFFENEKLLLKKNGLMPLNEKGIIWVENMYKK